MIHRSYLAQPKHSFLLFGARGTGKSSWLNSVFKNDTTWAIDLLDAETEDRFRQNPSLLESQYLDQKKQVKWISIDEIQRLPRLLDLVHRMIEKYGVKFALTGSSARKLKRGAANLLAGRAFVNYLFPLTYVELKKEFNLDSVLRWGSLPKIYSLADDKDKASYLRSYALVYLNEEIKAEQIVRKIEPFRDFLEVSAQMNGKILNHSKIANEVGAETKTIQSYYSILEDTWMGFHLPAYHRSIRKAQRKQSKFYWFDIGVKKALERSLDMPARMGTSYFGEVFEHFIILEIFRLNHYLGKDYRLSYFMTLNSGAEIDLIIDRGRKSPILVEIKSNKKVDESEVRALERIANADFKGSPCFYLSQDSMAQKIGRVSCLPWQEGISRIFDLE